MANRWFWTDEKRAQLAELAASGMISADIAAALETTRASVLTFAGRHGIRVIKFSAAMQAVYDARSAEREKKRQELRKAANLQKKVAKRKSAMSRGDFTALAVQAATSKTSRAYRLALPPIGEMTKSQLREMLADAVRNTSLISALEPAMAAETDAGPESDPPVPASDRFADAEASA